eukprot:scaffold32569_cov64-Phaeocystis_antarctica.AAC.2
MQRFPPESKEKKSRVWESASDASCLAPKSRAIRNLFVPSCPVTDPTSCPVTDPGIPSGHAPSARAATPAHDLTASPHACITHAASGTQPSAPHHQHPRGLAERSATHC